MKKERTQCSIILKDGRQCSRGVWTGAPNEGLCIGHSQNNAALAIKRGAAFSGKIVGKAGKGVKIRDRRNHLKAIENGDPFPKPLPDPIKLEIPTVFDLNTVEGRQALRTSVIKNVVSGHWDPKQADIVLKALSDAAREDSLTVSDPASDILIDLQNELTKKSKATG